MKRILPTTICLAVVSSYALLYIVFSPPRLELDELKRAVATADEEGRRAAVEAIGELLARGPEMNTAKEAIAILTTALRDACPLVRSAAARSLARGDKLSRSAAPELLILLKDENAGVRQSAAWSLGWLGIGEAAEPLSELAVKDADKYVRDAALEALSRLGAKSK